jgi:hypothetical protein
MHTNQTLLQMANFGGARYLDDFAGIIGHSRTQSDRSPAVVNYA